MSKQYILLPRCSYANEVFMSVCLSVCPSVCPSNACIVTKQTKVLPTFLYHMKGIEVHLVFWHKEWLVGTSPSTWNFRVNRVKLTRSLQNGDIQSIFARSAAAFRPSEKSSIITNRKSTTSFPMSLGWTAYVAPNLPQRGLKNANWTFFSSKRVLLWKKVWRKVSLWENFQRQCCKAFTAYLAMTKWLVGDVPFYLKFSTKVTHPIVRRRFSIYFRSYVLVVTASKRTSIITNRKSTTGFLMSLRWTSYTASKPPHKRVKNAKWPILV